MNKNNSIIIKNIVNIFQILLKLLLVLVIICFVYTKLEKIFKTKNIDTGVSFKSLPNNSQDIIVLGSSHSEFSFVPEFIYEDLELYSYVLHSACQPFEVSYQMLKEAYKTQNPKLVVLEMYAALPFQIKCMSDSTYVLPSYMMTGQERINTLNYLPIDKATNYYNDFYINHNNWRTIESIDDLNVENQILGIDKISNTFGYHPLYPNLPSENHWKPTVYENDIDVTLDQEDLNYLNQILKLCKEHNTDLLLYAMPWDGISVEDQSCLHKLWNWANENNIKYIDFIEESKTNGYTMHIHSDSQHANVSGAGLVTTKISEVIKENYNFNHHDNDVLNSIYYGEEFTRISEYLNYEYNPLIYIDRIKSYKGTVVLRYSGHDKQLDENLLEKLIEFGVGEDFRTDYGYIAIFNNGKLLSSSYDNLIYEIDNHSIEVNYNEIKLDGNVINDYGPLSFTLLSNDYTNNITKRSEYREDHLWETGFVYYNE